MNIYKSILSNNIQKLLTLYNLDPHSATLGYGDRMFWGWKTIDFPNGTLQGGVHALAIALKLGLVENEAFALKVINNAVLAVKKIRFSNGSLAEAYPFESSVCVTALVAFDVLSAVDHLEGRLSKEQKQEYLSVVSPLIDFISKNDETHAIICNHIATSVAALALWSKLSGSDNSRYKTLLDVLTNNQSAEGWHKEYEGADPGYQTLCNHYLFCAYQATNDDHIKDSLLKTAAFLKYLVHPDGTTGGLYGSRNTEVYYPGGLVGMAHWSDDTAAIAAGLHAGVLGGSQVYPRDIDTGNFIPLLNSYAVAALNFEKNSDVLEDQEIDQVHTREFKKDLKDAGLLIRSTSKYYAILNYKKGGTIKVFNKRTGTIDCEDGGIFGALKNDKTFSTQHYNETAEFDPGGMTYDLYLNNEDHPSPAKFTLLRLLSSTVLRVPPVNKLFKKTIVNMLMTGKKKAGGSVKRRFEFTEDKVFVHEEIDVPSGCSKIGHFGKCKSIHMASSGYYLKQLEQLPDKPELVEFI